jgi:hypothetical protein
MVSLNIKISRVGCGSSAYNRNYSGGRDSENCDLKPVQAETWDPIWKIIKAKRAGGVVQVTEHLPRKCKALSSKTPIPQKICI